MRKNRKPKIGIDIYGWDIAISRAYYLPLLIFLIPQIRKDMGFVFIDTLNRSHTAFHAVGKVGIGSNTDKYKFHDPLGDIKLLASLDMIISTKLHAGLVCLSYGIPFICLFGREKTNLFMNNIHLSDLCFSHRQMHSFISLMLNGEKVRHLIDQFRVTHFQHLKDQSYGHLEALARILEKHRKSEGRPTH